MPVNLQVVQKATNEAHQNFLRAMEIDSGVYRKPLLIYINQFLSAPVERPIRVRQCAENLKASIAGSESAFATILQNVAFTRLEMNLLVNSASLKSSEMALNALSDYSDSIMSMINERHNTARLDYDCLNKRIKQLKLDSANLGYAVALLEQLSAKLINERHHQLGSFCSIYLTTNTSLQVIQSIDQNDVFNILFEAISASIEYLALVGLIKTILDTWDKKRMPRAGFKPGDTDILFELADILDPDNRRAEQVQSALSQVTIHAEELRRRTEEAW